jgi:hypothetical protein
MTFAKASASAGVASASASVAAGVLLACVSVSRRTFSTHLVWPRAFHRPSKYQSVYLGMQCLRGVCCDGMCHIKPKRFYRSERASVSGATVIQTRTCVCQLVMSPLARSRPRPRPRPLTQPNPTLPYPSAEPTPFFLACVLVLPWNRSIFSCSSFSDLNYCEVNCTLCLYVTFIRQKTDHFINP